MHANNEQKISKSVKTWETESQNPVVIEQPEDLPSTSGVGSHVQSRLYMFAYLGGDTPGTKMEMTLKKFTKKYKSDRCIGDNDG